MHLKPINRQGKKRRKVKIAPTLSCEHTSFYFHVEEPIELPKSPEAKTETKKDKAAA